MFERSEFVIFSETNNINKKYFHGIKFYFYKFATTPKIFYLKNPCIISSSASFSVSPKVISFISCAPAIFPMAAS